MTEDFSSAGVEIRERRLGSVTGYCGSAGELVKKSRDCSLRNRERSFSQCGTCSSFCATLQLSLVRDAAVVNHAPAGCAGDFSMFNLYNRYGLTKRKLDVINARLVSTDLTEQDTIFGAKEKLLETLRETYRRFHPKTIFVTASCATGIIGEDVQAATEEAEAELGIPVAAVDCEGFRSQIWATGWDTAYNAILRKVVKPTKERHPERVNVITFIGDDYFSELLKPLGLEPKLIVPFAGIDELSRLSEAGATVQMCPTLGTWFAAGLEKLHGVPEIKSPPPYGLAATDRWLREIGQVFGKEKAAEELILSERAAIDEDLNGWRNKYRGLRAFVAAGPAHGHSYLSVLGDLGFEIAGGVMLHHDPKLDHGDARGDTLGHVVETHGDFNYGVCNKQSYELVNHIRRLKPDVLVLRHPGMVALGAKLGIPTLFVDDEHLALGYRGLLRYARKIEPWLRNPSIERNLARTARLPYTDWWLGKEAQAFLGEES
jgi:nitrogenase molybdenum-iron protein alpha chain